MLEETKRGIMKYGLFSGVVAGPSCLHRYMHCRWDEKIMNDLQHIRRGLRTVFKGFRSVGISFAVFTLLNLAVFFIISLWPGLLSYLRLSASNPWGIVTSNFTQQQVSHLSNNLGGFTFYTWLFVIICMALKVEVRRRWSSVFFWLVFLSGIVGNAIEYGALVLGVPIFGGASGSYGSSGIVYGTRGLLMAACIGILPICVRALIKEHRRKTYRQKKQWLFMFDLNSPRITLLFLIFIYAIFLLLFFLVPILTDPEVFLSAAPGTDVIAHGLGFLLGFSPALLLFIRFEKR